MTRTLTRRGRTNRVLDEETVRERTRRRSRDPEPDPEELVDDGEDVYDEDDVYDDNDDVEPEDEDQGERRSKLSTVASIGRGWSAHERYREMTSNYVTRYKFKQDRAVLLKFLEDDPFVSYLTRYIQSKQRSYVDLGPDDPLAALGIYAQQKTAFNAVVVAVDGDEDESFEPYLTIVDASPSLAGQLRDIHEGRRGPLSNPNLYIEITQYKKPNGFLDYRVEPIKARDLKEDWGVVPLSEDEVEDFLADVYTADDYPPIPSYEEVAAVAAEIIGAGGGDESRRSRGSRNGREAPPSRRRR